MTIPEGYAQVTHLFTGSSAPTGAAVTYGLDITIYVGTLSALAAEVHDNFCDQFKSQIPATLTINSTLVKAGPDATGPSVLYSLPTNGTAAGAGASSAPSTIIQKTTAFGGKAGRGRFFLPGVLEGNVGPDGVIGGTALTNLQNAANTFFTRLNTNDTPMVLLHQAGSPLSSPTIVEALVVAGVVGTQRRRQRR